MNSFYPDFDTLFTCCLVHQKKIETKKRADSNGVYVEKEMRLVPVTMKGGSSVSLAAEAELRGMIEFDIVLSLIQ